MIHFLIKRILYGFLVLLGAVVVVFFIFNVLPGDPVNMMAGQRTDVATREAIAKELGLDLPIHKQLFHYINDLSLVSIHEDTPKNQNKYDYTPLLHAGKQVVVWKIPYLRRSFQSNKLVSEIIVENVAGTFWLALSAMSFATIIGICLGIFASMRQNSLLDHSIITFSVIGISMPSFVFGALMAMIFGDLLSDYTGLNASGSLWENNIFGDRELKLKNLILPTITLGLSPMTIIIQLTRSSMLEVLSQDYIRTARAKGLGYYTIIFKHALKNALNPVITAVSGWLASLMAGAFFVESIFGWKGLGSVTINAVLNLDFPVVMGATIFVALVFIITNIFVDIFYALIDPRVRLK
ncbi:ABC transporter permease [Cytophaga hutchinsonii]|uniref:Dipeptide ABC transporter, permease component n=1 Tax=Cytophaga hutchinsonii (strain ATCC 33406 / DSM 1761 / CIP 103989 / NBRC 15051 / NCIMB 9469 / D465) TaxID=269798 RepID=A0A6N4SVH1_CYTH3|nr:ABC transporter permease [Cytophaga hutchinsonii]ABG60465.1 dipeptide ABC transporter, permease component [Cytophaga hutchinsonii ATCC 33406]SFX85378.1 peptide/nickel transport system permease protein [Cytophaga hutchinsonii ATCC 33406]